MLPALTARARRFPRRRLLSAAASAALFAAAVGSTLLPGELLPPEETGALPRLADRLPAARWGLAVPTSWFAAPPPELRPGDRVDVLALRPAERASAAAIALDLEVMSVDERVVVLGVTAADASALAVARASGQLIVPLLRSTR